MQLVLSADEAMLRDVVGADTFLRGREYARQGAVLNPQWRGRGEHMFGQVLGTGHRPYTAIAVVDHGPDGALRDFRGSCTCPVRVNCKHSVALALAVLPADAERVGAGWEQALQSLVQRQSPESDEPGASAGIGLQFQLGLAELGDPDSVGVGMRPVLPGRNGGWVRTGVNWSNVGFLGYGRRGIRADHLQLLGEIQAMDPSVRYGGASHAIHLGAVSSRRVWDVLAELRAAGLPFVQSGRAATAVRLRGPATFVLDTERKSDGLALHALLRVDGEPIALDTMSLLGEPAHGLAWTDNSGLCLAPLERPLDPALRGLLAARTLLVPPADEERFFGSYYPALRQRVPMTSADRSVELPEIAAPQLLLSVAHVDAHRVEVRWSWRYRLGAATRSEPLWPSDERGYRDACFEAGVLARVEAVTAALPALTSQLGSRLAPVGALDGIAAVRFGTEVLPRLADIEHLVIETAGVPVSYHEAADDPMIEVVGDPDPDDRDWFDLAVTVSVEGEKVPFERLFVALTNGESHLVLSSGTYFALDRPEFRALAQLIAESRRLQERGRQTVRLSRFQAGLWDELERLGVIGGQAAEWQRTVRALTGGDPLPAVTAPSTLEATLRPYQHDGFAWLSFLYRHRLGGILADDMGLGKTVQTLALICEAQQAGGLDAPFLVVAPTSVVSNWAAECAQFAPGLRVAVISETRKRRRRTLRTIAAKADVVVTSYTLFRLEYDDYEKQPWSSLVLDEAQFVKNHQSQAHHCAKRLPAPVKIAITGTPMENNLLELWALLSITAPGLFPSPARFEQDYRRPIERQHDAATLDDLRRRVRPFMLRRAKQDVARDLPDKQEQIVQLDLEPRHREVYQTYLQRERQKVLGLLDDLDGNRFEILRSLTVLRQACLDASLVDPEHAGVPSTKLDVLVERVRELAAEGHRTLVFSQFTRFLGAARDRLDAAGIDYCYLDGKTRQRRAVLAEFKAGFAPVFLISLKAGGFGLNLTEADYCILLDPWWNPATEAQAVDRTHRIGQTKNVMVYRLVAKDTIEEKVLALQAAKSALVGSVLGDGDFAGGSLTAADIRGLLR